jgi:hypothetical protein
MPIVVDEVVISVEVSGPGGGAAPPGGGAGAGEALVITPGPDPQALVEECVERVLEILARRKER